MAGWVVKRQPMAGWVVILFDANPSWSFCQKNFQTRGARARPRVLDPAGAKCTKSGSQKLLLLRGMISSGSIKSTTSPVTFILKFLWAHKGPILIKKLIILMKNHKIINKNIKIVNLGILKVKTWFGDKDY